MILTEIFTTAPFGLFYDGNIVCAGYTLAYSYLMNELGIDCEYVCSNKMVHAWNKIKIDGNWYNADLTFDDLNYQLYSNTRGSVTHSFFLKSDSYFTSESGHYHYDINTYDNCESTSTLYDDAFFNDVNSMIYVVDGDFYYLDPDYTYGRVYLTKRDLQGSETRLGYQLPASTMNFTQQFYDSSGNIHETQFADLLARITYLDGRFYVAANKRLYSMKFDGTRMAIDNSLANYVCGLGVSGKNLVYNVYNSADDYVLDKLEYFNNYITDAGKTSYNNYPDIDNDGYVNAKDYALIVK